MILFFLLCGVSVLAGLGVVAALGLKVDRTHAALLAPGVCLVCWAIGLGTGVSLGVPVGRLALPLWAATAAAATFGAWQTRARISQEAIRLLLVAAALPIILMPFDFWQGPRNFIGGPAGDGWSYVAFGQYLWEMPKGIQGHLTPLHQYAAHLHRARFIGSTLLGLISPLTGEGGDTQAAAGYFVAWSLFVFGASCAFVGFGTGLRRVWLPMFCVLAVASRWVVGAVEVHNYDNLLAITFLPMVVGIFAGLQQPDLRGSVALGGLLAAAVYIYPEMVVFVVMGGTIAFVRRMLGTENQKDWIVMVACAGILAAIVLLPASSDLRWFIANQMTNATAAVGTRAGEGGFSELMKVHDWGAAFWGLTSSAAELRGGLGWQLVRQSLGLAMWVLTLIGLGRALKTRQWDVALIAVALMTGALAMVVRAQYSYGAYKFILLGWWSMIWLAVVGAQDLVRRTVSSGASPTAEKLRLGIVVALSIVWAGLLASVAGRAVMFHRSQPATTMEPYRQVLTARSVIGDAAIVVDVNDTLANQWAVYFLREHPMLLLGYRGYMAFPHVVPLMEEAAPVNIQALRYVLSDELSGEHEIVWKQAPYVLWRIPKTGAAFVRRVVNANGLEQMNGRPFFWIGQGDTELDILATTAGEATLSGRFTFGPSVPGLDTRRLLVGSTPGSGQALTVAQQGTYSFSVPVSPGHNPIYMRALDHPIAAAPNAADRRPLVVGVEGLNASLRER